MWLFMSSSFSHTLKSGGQTQRLIWVDKCRAESMLLMWQYIDPFRLGFWPLRPLLRCRGTYKALWHSFKVTTDKQSICLCSYSAQETKHCSRAFCNRELRLQDLFLKTIFMEALDSTCKAWVVFLYLLSLSMKFWPKDREVFAAKPLLLSLLMHDALWLRTNCCQCHETPLHWKEFIHCWTCTSHNAGWLAEMRFHKARRHDASWPT